MLNQVLPELGAGFASLRPPDQRWVQTVVILSGGFIVTSLLWATTLAHLIDGKVRAASSTRLLAGLFALFGVIHSPLTSSPIVWARRGGPPTESRRSIRRDVRPDALPLGRRLCRRVCLLGPDRPDRTPSSQAGRPRRASTVRMAGDDPHSDHPQVSGIGFAILPSWSLRIGHDPAWKRGKVNGTRTDAPTLPGLIRLKIKQIANL